MFICYHSFNDFKRRMLLSRSQKLLALLRRIMPKHDGDIYCLNCLQIKLEYHKKVLKKKVFVVF